MLLQLLLVKRFFVEASEYVEQNEPISSGIAISLLQDSVEMYVWNLIKERNVAVKDQSGFTNNIESLSKAGETIPNVAKLLELNKARVGFKHYGNIPDPSEAVKFQTYVEDFLRAAMLAHFNVAFDELSLVDLIRDPEIQGLLRAAEKHISISEFTGAAAELAKAKTVIFSRIGRHLPSVDSQLSRTDDVINEVLERGSIDSFRYVSDYLNLLREFSLVNVLRFSLKDYTFLRERLPIADQSLGGTWYVNHKGFGYTVTDCKKALFCLVKMSQRLEVVL
jgi:hypothetical protein